MIPRGDDHQHEGNIYPLSSSGFVWGFQPITLKWLLLWLDASNHYDLPVPRRRHGHPLLTLTFRLGRDMAKLPAGQIGRDCFYGNQWTDAQFRAPVPRLQFTTVTNSTLITATTPAITSVCAYLILHEAFSKKQWLGILLSFSGVLAVITKGNFDMIRTMSFNVGDVFCIASQLAWAFYSLASRKLTGHMDVLAWPFFWLVQSLRDSRNRYLWDFFKHPCPFSLAACSLSFLSLYHPFRRDCRQCLLEHWRQECRSQRQFRLFEFHARHGNGCRVSHFANPIGPAQIVGASVIL